MWEIDLWSDHESVYVLTLYKIHRILVFVIIMAMAIVSRYCSCLVL